MLRVAARRTDGLVSRRTGEPGFYTLSADFCCLGRDFRAAVLANRRTGELADWQGGLASRDSLPFRPIFAVWVEIRKLTPLPAASGPGFFPAAVVGLQNSLPLTSCLNKNMSPVKRQGTYKFENLFYILNIIYLDKLLVL